MANEKRLIDYSEIRKLFDEEFRRIHQLILDGETHLDNLAEGFHSADKVIWKLPTVDAVEVVRCEKCKHWNKRNYTKGLCMNHSNAVLCFTKPGFYCACGERIEGE